MAVIRERYPATVTSIEDEDGDLGRIRVSCAGLMGDEDTELPMVVEPAHDWGWFYMPDVGEIVEVEVVVSTDEDEIAGQASIDNLDIVWRGKRFYSDNEDESEPTRIHDDFTALNYGKRRGFATPFGHTLIFDDTEGDPRIILTLQTEKLEQGEAPDPTKFTRLEIEPDGSLKVAFLDNHQIHLTTEKGNLIIALDGPPGAEKHKIEFDAETPKVEVTLENGAHNMKLEPTEFSANLDNGVTVKFEAKDAAAKMTVGDGSKHVAIVETLKALWGDMVTHVDSHSHDILNGHTIVSGGSGSPAIGVDEPTTSEPPNESSPGWDDNINSTKIAIPDG